LVSELFRQARVKNDGEDYRNKQDDGRKNNECPAKGNIFSWLYFYRR
jgi:hypothetical protein